MTTQKVALFQRVGDGSWLTTWNRPAHQPDEAADKSVLEGYVRISPWLEIEFPALDDETIVKSQLKQLDKAEQVARQELQQRLNAINETRQKLLALTFKPAA